MESVTRLFAGLGLLLVCGMVHAAESPQDLFKQGNAAYADGKFAEAIPLYERARDAGLRHWALHYNLGNALYRSGRLGPAVAQYERSFRLNSASADTVYNLNLAATRAGDPRVPESALPALFWRLFYFLSLNLLTLATSLLFFALTIYLAGGLLERWSIHRSAALPPALVLVFLLLWTGVRIYLQERPIAIVTSATAEVRSGPNLTYPANFTVPEGRRVLVLKEQEAVAGWVEIGVPQEGLKGWVPDSAVDVL
jgi:tetratricopeptide (TPR) repeat protein